MKKFVLLLGIIFGMCMYSYSEVDTVNVSTEMQKPPRGKQAYRPGGRATILKPFYSRKKAPKKKNHKNMPSATRHIG